MIASPLARSISARKTGRLAVVSRERDAVAAPFAVPQSAMLVILASIAPVPLFRWFVIGVKTNPLQRRAVVYVNRSGRVEAGVPPRL
jgi:hypothetical protein